MPRRHGDQSEALEIVKHSFGFHPERVPDRRWAVVCSWVPPPVSNLFFGETA